MSSTSRRSFLQTASTVAAGAALVNQISSRAYAQSRDTLNVGLVGCGGRGRGAAVQALSTEGNVRLVGLADAFEEPIDSAKNSIEREVKNKPADKGQALVEVPDENKFVGLDAYEKLPETARTRRCDPRDAARLPPDAIRGRVKRGVNVFIEKPVAVDAPGVRQVLAAAEEAKKKNLKIGVGLQRRHQPCYLEMMDKIHNGEIGDILCQRVYWNGGGVWDPKRTRDQVKTEMEYQIWNWYYYNWLCGDHICEQHIHNLDVGCWVKQDYPVRPHGMGGRQVRIDKRYGEIFDHHAVEYYFKDGSVMISQCRHISGCWSAVSEHGHGTKGFFDLDSNPKACRLKDRQQSVIHEFTGSRNDPYQYEHDDLFHAIRNDIRTARRSTGPRAR